MFCLEGLAIPTVGHFTAWTLIFETGPTRRHSFFTVLPGKLGAKVALYITLNVPPHYCIVSWHVWCRRQSETVDDSEKW